ncbi:MULTISPECIES: molecular chaperone DnaJ [Kribbella]|uniref:Chaperone protein DnaJ n=2 Tax=Kribbella TaxID=182639 RepID=A0A4V2M5Q6_9ACTN|nr:MULTISPECIES: molecular chaperone DnaJ [Kribbella]TCC20832.1 molecular chaperone DnaJ [Kribbella speibonae]TCC40832.1 molecular chaperone DnaJ [Kribbella speibonae]TCC43141.1 molecular chaperone DnaJ [Kribbella sindirgiensis]
MSTKDWIEKDFYKVLGVSKTAEADEIKKAYRKLARQYHPDSNAGDTKAEAKFKEVSEAYDVVGDPKKRKEYDEARRLFGSGGFRMPTGSGQGGGFDFNVGDLFNRGGQGGGSGLGDILGGMFGGGGRTTTSTTARPRRGQDIETEATIEFAEAVNGVTVGLRMTSDEPCATCRGTGAKYGTVPKVCLKCEGTGMQTSVQGGVFAMTEPCTECKGRGLVVDQPCETCHGSGRGQSSKTMQVRIPAGVQDNQRIRLKGKGAAGERGGPAGDLYVTVHVHKHRIFGRQGEHLTLNVPVSFTEAALGAEIKVPTLDGLPVTVRIPAGTANGSKLRVRGKGSVRRDGTKGDLMLTLQVQVPHELTDEQKEKLQEFSSASDQPDLRAGLFGSS